ncbi:hypothetical protein [Limosilactobacillus antri]|uniref:hypothetical protein n=1 Tax=Limosilactobacillus antri TaxID=227943 RepID=UPI001F592C36|nr:hypothetical protein [Limosilactobacillus antri]
MSFDLNTQIEGQRDWSKIIENNFLKLNVEHTSTDNIVLLNGWQAENGNKRLDCFRLLDGTKLCRFTGVLKKSGITPNEEGWILKTPAIGTVLGNPFPKTISVGYEGSAGGYLELGVGNDGGTGVWCHFVPNDGGVHPSANKPHDIRVEMSVVWFAKQ